MKTCKHESGYTWALVDARGIYVKTVCDDCVEIVMQQYQPWVWTGYDQSQCDESIEDA